MAQRVSLEDLITEAATQLRNAAEAAGDDPVMNFQECELEMAVSVENQGGGGVRIHVVELGGHRRKTNANTIRVRFSSLPERPIVLPVVTAAPSSEGKHPPG